MLTDQATGFGEVLTAVILWDVFDHLIDLKPQVHLLLVLEVCVFMADADTIAQGRQDEMTEARGLKEIREEDVFRSGQNLIRKWIEIHETVMSH